MPPDEPRMKPPDSQVEIRFSLKGPDGAFIDELDLEADIDRFRREFQAVEDNLGRLMIQTRPGRTVFIEDELDYLVPEFCFRACAELANGRQSTIRLSRYSGQVTVSPSAEEVLISGSSIDPLLCFRNTLMGAMLDCGDRFLSCYQRLRGGMDDFDWRIREIQAARLRVTGSPGDGAG